MLKEIIFCTRIKKKETLIDITKKLKYSHCTCEYTSK